MPSPLTRSLPPRLLSMPRLLLAGALLALAGCSSLGPPQSTATTKTPSHAVTTTQTIPWYMPQYGAESPEAAQDIWERIRKGYQLQALSDDNPRIDHQRFGFANRPASLQRIAERSSPYIHYVVERLEEQGMPLELALLPMIESSYNPLALSPAQAAGLWQFIPSTGRHFNLRQTRWYDGRRDITASTNAAIRYLRRLHDMFNGDWLLALAAYNAGEGTVSRAIERNFNQGLPTDYWNLPLPRETQDYVPKLLALAQIIQAPQGYGLDLPAIANEPYFEQIRLPHRLDLARIASLADMDEDELFKLNPAFKQRIAVDGPLRLLVPIHKAEELSSSIASLPPSPLVISEPEPVAKPARSPAPHRYRVRSGDNLWEVARRHQVKVADLQRWNGLKGHRLRVGQTLLVQQAPGAQRSATTSNSTRKATRYQVRRGDSLYSIAKRFSIGLKTLQSWNPRLGRQLKPGQTVTLYLPAR
ncbi:transglycosylase SLT domain-containing protein [Pseudomonas sp. NW5]|uniref:transglycosylase SLT domain-containing protein n=1 Tax=Pseudomonas sp. NW5 TaxID=2934934 RepID=UPI002022403F|nr:transglycosylase SLT domain-containing protein [Pseudomonas sp. NW5]MCL7462015.1 transglycosylase SLT domain-containing protein [Pseudomonas sp. NW5]